MTIADEVLARANLYARKAFNWMSRELERDWRREFGSRWETSDAYYNADQDYGEAYWFAQMAGLRVLESAGITEDKFEVYWDDGLTIERYLT